MVAEQPQKTDTIELLAYLLQEAGDIMGALYIGVCRLLRAPEQIIDAANGIVKTFGKHFEISL